MNNSYQAIISVVLQQVTGLWSCIHKVCLFFRISAEITLACMKPAIFQTLLLNTRVVACLPMLIFLMIMICARLSIIKYDVEVTLSLWVPWGSWGIALFILKLGVRWGHLDPSTYLPPKQCPIVSTEQEAGLARESVSTLCRRKKSFVSTENRNMIRRVSQHVSQSVLRLTYPVPK